MNGKMVDTEFIEALASKAPTPGGGGASAYAGALASALASMVGNLTVGKKKYADVEERMQAELVELEGTRGHLLALIDEDARAFEPLAAAYGMPKGSDEERAVLALSDAGAAAVLAKAALQAASLNVVINIGSMDDAERAEGYRNQMEDLLAAGCAMADEVYADVVKRLS